MSYEPGWKAGQLAMQRALQSASGNTTAFIPDTTGSQAGASSGRKYLITGDLTDVPVSNDFEALYVNRTAAPITVTPVSPAVCVSIESGAEAPFVTIGINKGVVVMGDGTDLIVMGDIV